MLYFSTWFLLLLAVSYRVYRVMLNTQVHQRAITKLSINILRYVCTSKLNYYYTHSN